MTRKEFANVMAYVALGCGKPLSSEALEVYFDCLGDLSFRDLRLGAAMVLNEHKFATFPQVAELREAATRAKVGEAVPLSSARAWELAWTAVRNIDPDIDGSVAKYTGALPPLVLAAMNAMGIVSLCYSKDPVSVVRAQFLRIFDSLAAERRAEHRLPPRVSEALAEVRRENALPPRVRGAIELAARSSAN